MNRRNFFKAVTGFVAGVCATFVPKAKGKRPLAKVAAEVQPSRLKKLSAEEFFEGIGKDSTRSCVNTYCLDNGETYVHRQYFRCDNTILGKFLKEEFHKLI